MHEAAIAKEVFDIAQQAMTENGLTRLTRRDTHETPGRSSARRRYVPEA